MPRNTGYKGFATRRRLINGVPDGYTEPNTAGPNYVPPVYDLTTCPLPPADGNIAITLNNVALANTTIKVIRISDSAIMYEQSFTGGALVSTTNIPASLTGNDYKVEIGVDVTNPTDSFRVIVNDSTGSTTFDNTYIGDMFTPKIDCGDFNSNITVLITNP